MSNTKSFRPLFLIPPGSITAADKKRAERFCGIIIIECSASDRARYLDLPIGWDVDVNARASLEVMRKVMAAPSAELNRGTITRWFADLLLSGTMVSKVPSVESVSRRK